MSKSKKQTLECHPVRTQQISVKPIYMRSCNSFPPINPHSRRDWQVFDSFYYGYAGFFKKQANRRTTLFQKTGQLFREYGFLYISMIQLRK